MSSTSDVSLHMDNPRACQPSLDHGMAFAVGNRHRDRHQRGRGRGRKGRLRGVGIIQRYNRSGGGIPCIGQRIVVGIRSGDRQRLGATRSAISNNESGEDAKISGG